MSSKRILPKTTMDIIKEKAFIVLDKIFIVIDKITNYQHIKNVIFS